MLLDSLSAYVPRIAQPETAAEALEQLTMIAIEFDCAVLFLHHFLKALARSVDAAIGGASAVQRIARSIHVFGAEPVDPLALLVRKVLGDTADEDAAVRILACHKLNVAATPPSLKFEIAIESLPTVEQVPVLVPVGECTHTDDDVFQQAKRAAMEEPTTELDAAVEWLYAALLDAPARARPWKQLQAEAAEAFSQRTLERARAKAKLVRVPPAAVRDQVGAEAVCRARRRHPTNVVGRAPGLHSPGERVEVKAP